MFADFRRLEILDAVVPDADATFKKTEACSRKLVWGLLELYQDHGVDSQNTYYRV